jgi:hypothetical protein
MYVTNVFEQETVLYYLLSDIPQETFEYDIEFCKAQTRSSNLDIFTQRQKIIVDMFHHVILSLY